MKTPLILLASLAILCGQLFAADAKADIKPNPAPKKAPPGPPPVPPTIADVPYGKHPKQVLTFWKAESSKPTPLLFYIHGGGWKAGNRSSVNGVLPEMLKAGISVVSIEYRFTPEATADKVVPPVKGPLHDAARALQ